MKSPPSPKMFPLCFVIFFSCSQTVCQFPSFLNQLIQQVRIWYPGSRLLQSINSLINCIVSVTAWLTVSSVYFRLVTYSTLQSCDLRTAQEESKEQPLLTAPAGSPFRFFSALTVPVFPATTTSQGFRGIIIFT